MREEELKDFLDIPQVVEIIKRWDLSSKIYINNMLNMAQRNDISVDVVNNIPIMEDGINKIYQTSKYTILNNSAYYVYHYWYMNQRVRGEVAVPCPRYGNEGFGFKLVIQNFIYKILPKK